MNDPKPFASLSPSLLARKGGARPAMRPQLQPMQQFHEATARALETDLGWNDMGHDQNDADNIAPVMVGGEVVPIHASADMPHVLHQQAELAERLVQSAAPVKETSRRRSALADGRKAAFTLRLDAERHLNLRLACTLSNRSAQQLVTEALDNLISALPDVAGLAAQVRKNRQPNRRAQGE